jgi:hypothetical protein
MPAYGTWNHHNEEEDKYLYLDGDALETQNIAFEIHGDALETQNIAFEIQPLDIWDEDDRELIVGTSKCGFIEADYAQLYALFGAPNIQMVEWNLKVRAYVGRDGWESRDELAAKGELFDLEYDTYVINIYDWPSDRDSDNFKKNTIWNIGGKAKNRFTIMEDIEMMIDGTMQVG